MAKDCEETAMKNRSLIILSIIYLFFYINNFLYPMSFGDDYLYAFIWTGQSMFVPLPEYVERVLSWSDLAKSQWLLFFTWGGRLVGQTLTQFFVWLGKDIFNFFNALASTILVAEVYWCANKGNVSLSFNVGRIGFIFFSFWAFVPSFNSVFLWLTGACIYLWPAFFLLAFLIPYIRKFYDFHKNIGSGITSNISIFLLGIIAGCGNENSICWIIIWLLVFLFSYRNCHGKEAWLYFGVVGIMIGYALLMLAPGNMARLHIVYGTDWFSYHVLGDNLNTFATVFIFQLVLWYYNLRSLYIIKKEKTKRRALNNDVLLVSVFCITSLLMSSIMLVSPFFPVRSGFPGTVLLIIASAILLRIQNEDRVVLMSLLAKKVLSCVGIAYFIMTAYITIHHSYDVTLQMNTIINEAQKLQADSSKETLIVKPLPETDGLTDLLSGFHFSNFSISEDVNDWRNVSFARYYSIRGIKVSE